MDVNKNTIKENNSFMQHYGDSSASIPTQAINIVVWSNILCKFAVALQICIKWRLYGWEFYYKDYGGGGR